MDTFYNIANYLHMLAALSLLLKIWCTQDCSGISGKTQFLLALVYTTRYLDLFTSYISTENAVFKILYLTTGYCTVLSIYGFFRKSYERKYDTSRIEMLLIPCMVIAIFINYKFTAIEVFWTFSIHLEAVAIIPQFAFVAKAKRIHKHMLYYIIALGIYKCLYIVHWLYRYQQEGYYDKFLAASGIIQFILYLDFFVRVVPYLPKSNGAEDQQQSIAVIGMDQAGLEDGLPEKSPGHLNGNISTILLTPASLLSASEDKVNLLKAEEANSKY